MADADEEAIRATTTEAPQIETDLLSDTSSASLPRRGEKDFEPNPTEFQADILSASRGAMHNALAHPRIHYPKTQVIGIYAPDGPTSPSQVKVDEKGLGVSSDYCVCVPIPKGQYFKTIGQADRWNRVWLLPEEAIPGLAGIIGRCFAWLDDPFGTSSTAAGPIVGCGIHRNYTDVYRKLATIPWYDPAKAETRDPLDTDIPFRVIFHVYKPSTPIKKSAWPIPDFRIAIVNTREQTSIPTLAQIGALLESTLLDPPRGEKMDRLMYMRLRHGYRNIILAVVDQGVTSFLRVSDAAFGKEKLYENKGPPTGSKRSGNFRPKKR
ncbi:hypothetical protein N7476_010017 [Penicillium atrosanguineum]|uniref:tRNA-splicing endonuclease subunit Sen54 N-terminal domain-containing protein n=1 Tax=Penicillium atrosanguineum TaxID=1132637 RepID=A0A9W9PQS4_9EURO|nr:hypothetical protein N7526_007824 [Penicillium atrosanguineum]KAJ5303218.1 hypothetical protein N7476_010017 [Penicillium atrosanguineum]